MANPYERTPEQDALMRRAKAVGLPCGRVLGAQGDGTHVFSHFEIGYLDATALEYLVGLLETRGERLPSLAHVVAAYDERRKRVKTMRHTQATGQES